MRRRWGCCTPRFGGHSAATGREQLAGLLAGAALACTPAAALIFRFNNPDALLVLLLTVAGYCLIHAVEAASWRWLALVGIVMGAAFLTKMLEGFLPLPAFALTYLLLAPTGWRNRLLHLLTATAALVAAAGWWVLAVQLVPASARPYIGGSTDNSVMQLAVGYNGVSRIVGRGGRDRPADFGSPAIGRGWSRLGGGTGLRRLFTAEMANEISWLLPAALVAAAFGVYLVFRGRLSRGEKAALTMFTGWLVVSALVFSYMSGMVHPYYTVAMAPAVAGLVGIGTVWAWRSRAGWDGRIVLAAMIALTAVMVGNTSAPQRLWITMVPMGPRHGRDCCGRRGAWPRIAPACRGRARRRDAGRNRRPNGILDRDRRHAAPRLDPDSAEEGRRPAGQLDGRRSGQS